jgi:hypothetical protein
VSFCDPREREFEETPPWIAEVRGLLEAPHDGPTVPRHRGHRRSSPACTRCSDRKRANPPSRAIATCAASRRGSPRRLRRAVAWSAMSPRPPPPTTRFAFPRKSSGWTAATWVPTTSDAYVAGILQVPPASIAGVRRWRDPDSYRGHHYFQSPRESREASAQCRWRSKSGGSEYAKPSRCALLAVARDVLGTPNGRSRTATGSARV